MRHPAPVSGRSLLLLVALLSAPPALLAQTPGAPPAPDCTSPNHRAFDFWLGSWDVTANGGPAGTNTITRTQRGCILHEHWTGRDGSTGESFNFYDRQDSRWHQLWVDARGFVLRLSGTFDNGVLRLAGETRNAQGSRVLQKLSFTPNPDGTVRQLWESSGDAGATWRVVFDGLYTRKPGSDR